MNPNKITEVRKLIEQSKQSGKRPHYSDAIKLMAKSLLKDGVSRAELNAATGISNATLANWAGPRRETFRKLKAVSAPALGAEVRVRLASGVCIELSDLSLLKMVLEQCA